MDICRLLDGQSPLSLDKYYLPTVTPGTQSAGNTVKEEEQQQEISGSSQEAISYVMPMGRELSVNLVSWVSVDEFYVHLKEQQRSFAEFVKTCQQVPKIPVRNVLTAGTVVLTTYSTTGLYYRAEIHDYNEKLQKYKVVFTDIGVRAIVAADQLYENPFAVTQVPKFSHKCCLVDREKLAGVVKDQEAMKRIGAIIQAAVDVKACVKERLKADLNVLQVTIDGKELWQEVVRVERGDAVVENANGATVIHNDGRVEKGGGDGAGDSPIRSVELGLVSSPTGDSGKLNPEMLKNQKLWMKPVDFLSKEVFRFSIRDIKGAAGELYKGTFERGAVHLGIYAPVEVVRITNQM